MYTKAKIRISFTRIFALLKIIPDYKILIFYPSLLAVFLSLAYTLGLYLVALWRSGTSPSSSAMFSKSKSSICSKITPEGFLFVFFQTN